MLVATVIAALDAAPYRQRFQGGYYPQAYYGDYYGYSPYYHDSFSGYPYAYSANRANPFQNFFSRFSSWQDGFRLPVNPFRVTGQVCVDHAAAGCWPFVVVRIGPRRLCEGRSLTCGDVSARR